MMSFIHVLTLLISLRAVLASLPYSVPDLGSIRHHPVREEASDTRPSRLGSADSTANVPSGARSGVLPSTGSVPSSPSRSSLVLSGPIGTITASSTRLSVLPSTSQPPYPTTQNFTATEVTSSLTIHSQSSSIPTQNKVSQIFASFETNQTVVQTVSASDAGGRTIVQTVIQTRLIPGIGSAIGSFLEQPAHTTLLPSDLDELLSSLLRQPAQVTQVPSSLESAISSLLANPSQATVLPTEVAGILSALLGESTQSVEPSSGPVASVSTMPSQTAQSSQPSRTGTPEQATIPFVVDAVIDGQAYHLPSPGEPATTILLADGSVSQLQSDKVVLRGQTLGIPKDLTSSQDISAGGQTIKAQPGESQKPPSGEGDSNQDDKCHGLFGAIGCAVSTAGEAASGLAGVGSKALDFAGNAAGTAAADVSKTMGSALKGASGMVSTLNGIQQALPLDQLTKDGLEAFSKAQNLGRIATNWLQSTGQLLDGFDKLPTETQQKIRDDMKSFAGKGGPLEQAGDAMKSFSKFPWENLPGSTSLPVTDGQTSALATISISSTQSQSKASTTTTGSPSTETTTLPRASTSSYTSEQGQNTTVDTASTQTSPSETAANATGTPTPSRNATQIETASASAPSSTAAGPSASESPVSYVIRTKSGTSMETYEKFIEELDGGKGQSDLFDLVPHQTYTTDLLPSKAEELMKKHDFILTLFPYVFNEIFLDSTRDEFQTNSPQEFNQSKSSRLRRATSDQTMIDPVAKYTKEIIRRNLVPVTASTSYWKMMIAQPPGDRTGEPGRAEFVTDDTPAGRGTTIYVVDDGFDTDNDELAANGREVETFLVSNDLAFPQGFLDGIRRAHPDAFLVEPTIKGTGFGHGTKMASIAAGKSLGVAPNADLFVAKYKGRYNRGDRLLEPDGTSTLRADKDYSVQPRALGAVLDKIRSHYEAKKKSETQSQPFQAVINLSWGVMINDPNIPGDTRAEQMQPLFDDFFLWSESRDIPVVMAAGNDVNRPLHRVVPQRFGTDTNHLITVGGVNADGTLFQNTSPHIPGELGSMTVFAPAVNIVAPGNDGNLHEGTGINDGTSQAAAMTSGLIAYLMALPSVNLIHNQGVPIPRDDAKEFIVAHAHERGVAPATQPQGRPPITFPKVIYNLANGDRAHQDDPCAVHFRKRANDTASACSLSQPSTSSTMQTSIRSSVSTATATNSGLPVTQTSAEARSSETSQSSGSSTASTPTATSSPTSTECQFSVKEDDSKNATDVGLEHWSLMVFKANGTSLEAAQPYCLHGAIKSETIGLDVECPHLGSASINKWTAQRENGEGLRFIWNDETWTNNDTRCSTGSWGDDPIDAEVERERWTNCTVECHLDTGLPIAWQLDN